MKFVFASLQILELMLISIQTFDVFDLRFMECDYFTSSIYNKLKTKLTVYQTNYLIEITSSDKNNEI